MLLRNIIAPHLPRVIAAPFKEFFQDLSSLRGIGSWFTLGIFSQGLVVTQCSQRPENLNKWVSYI